MEINNRKAKKPAINVILRSRSACRVLARWEMREGRAEQAYILASRHYLDDGESYADLEWLSGYISLLYLGDPTQALGHFQNALRASGSPSRSARTLASAATRGQTRLRLAGSRSR